VSLAKLLAAVVPQGSNRHCGTCYYIEKLPAEDRAAWDGWIAADRSIAQLWEIARGDDTNPYRLSLAAMRMCIRTHRRDEQ
jgi:hypothetical protein